MDSFLSPIWNKSFAPIITEGFTLIKLNFLWVATNSSLMQEGIEK